MTEEWARIVRCVECADESAAMVQADVGIIIEPKVVVEAIERALPYLMVLDEWREGGRVGPPPAPDAATRPMVSTPLRGDWDWVNLYPGHGYDEWCRHCEPDGPSPVKYPFGRPAALPGRE